MHIWLNKITWIKPPKFTSLRGGSKSAFLCMTGWGGWGAITVGITSLPEKHKEICITPQLKDFTACYLYLYVQTSLTEFRCKFKERLCVCTCVYSSMCVCKKEIFVLRLCLFKLIYDSQSNCLKQTILLEAKLCHFHSNYLWIPSLRLETRSKNILMIYRKNWRFMSVLWQEYGLEDKLLMPGS